MHLIVSLFGIQIPALILIFLFAGVIQILLNRVFADLGVYEFVWHPGLFRTAIFICIFASFSLIIYK
ncbi:MULTISPECIES: DUF1656 domain-containing protein [Malaciobacter]|jgi:hypothetical protein|uniref:DUF1656 domain-containing protein n=1 Tax=Malaciobacter marinus TaxID=505249 RepID=A0A1T4ZSL0_9BACT|nr:MULTISPECIES: DUF1656 domain-containing protein [Malaciobacter]AXX86765.1 putative efflux system membrane protein (DUF1656 domain) [Malaciobacter marinus]PHO12973.1 DUF1656 domain-containing protein [Malaciobacter marinus]PHO15968.1 DUF1656 domain-containing protein [Malaciobacter marinus]PPK61916.1 uncharacterized protein DUF1656 [Malaciobacter marinus]RYA23325.1 DUF1656 domain-containing protein [Malaciobacter halophilus]